MLKFDKSILDNWEQSLNKYAIEVTDEVLKFIKFKDVRELHPENIYSKVVTDEVSKLSIFKSINDLHPLNKYFIDFTKLVLKLLKERLVRLAQSENI